MTHPEGPGGTGLLVASDLDRTLIYSEAAMRLGEAVPSPVCVETYDGRPTSFISPTALERLGELSRRMPFVPVTTRTVEQYRRIRLDGVRVRHAVTTNGAVLLEDGEPCPQWQRRVEEALADSASYAEAEAAFDAVLERPWVLKRRSAEDRFCYAVFDTATVGADWYDELERAALELGWVLSVQGRKAYLIPGGLTKQAAVAEVARRVGAERIAAAGDSLLDAGILELADHPVRPAHGELHDQGWHRPGLVVTEHPGGRAGEEIVDLFAELTSSRVTPVDPSVTVTSESPA